MSELPESTPASRQGLTGSSPHGTANASTSVSATPRARGWPVYSHDALPFSNLPLTFEVNRNWPAIPTSSPELSKFAMSPDPSTEHAPEVASAPHSSLSVEKADLHNVTMTTNSPNTTSSPPSIEQVKVEPQENDISSTINPVADCSAESRSIDELNGDHTLVKQNLKEPDATPTPAAELPQPVIPRKRGAPKKKAPTGAKKPLPKRRKIDKSDDRDTPMSARRSSTSSSINLYSKKSGRKGSESVTPALRSPSIFEASSDDGAIYCICRKPDNHTWMIACDGGCEDWFHGKCVHINQEDEELIDRYICPNCTEKGLAVTTWKPMCRRESCRKPARLKKGKESKYCSGDCGLLFMKQNINLSRSPRASLASRRRHGTKMTVDQGTTEPDLGPLGGAIRPYELKALVHSVKTAADFRILGSSGILTPPESEAQEAPSKDYEPAYSAVETSTMERIAARKEALTTRRSLISHRHRLVDMAREQATRLAKENGIKDLCSYDPRLAMDDSTLRQWRDSEEGGKAFETSILPIGDGEDGSVKPCGKKRCEKHKTWQKMVLQDVRNEGDDNGNEMRLITEEEMAIRNRALVRARMQMHEPEGGTVEVVC